MKIILENKKIQLLIILLLTVLVYLNIFQNSFVWDDNDFILGWQAAKSWDNLPALLSGELPGRHEGVFRPMRSVIYLATYSLFQQNIFWYHLHSLIVHLLATFLIYFITLKICKKSFFAFLTALFFGLHPAHTEAITYITVNFDIWGIVLMLASFYFWLVFRNSTKAWIYFLSLALSALAVFTYEIALTLPLIILAYEFFWHRQNWPKIFQQTLPYFLAPAGYFAIKIFVPNLASRSAPLIGNGLTAHILAIIKIIATYIIIIIWPFNLTVFPPMIQSFWLAVLILAAVVAAVFWTIKKYKSKLAPFATVLFFISLIPVAQIMPTKIIMAERYLYLGSFGFCLILTWVLLKFIKFPQNEGDIGQYRLRAKILFGVIIIIAVFYAFATFTRNQDWKNEEVLWTKTVLQTPENAQANHNLGTTFFKKGNYQNAILKFKKAIKLNPNYPEAYNSLGRTYEATEVYGQAIAAYKQALTLEPNYLDAIKNLGDAYLARENFKLAVLQYQRYLEFEANDAATSNNLAVAYLNLGRLAEAKKYFNLALTKEPNLAGAKIGLAISLMLEKNYPAAKNLLLEVLTADPDNEVAQEKLLQIDELNNN